MLAPHSRVLVINVCRIGDTLLVTPILRALKAACPAGRLGCLAHPDRAALLQGLPFLDELGTITAKVAWLRGWRSGKNWDYAIVYGHDVPLIRYAARVARQVVAFRQENEADNHRLWRTVTEAGADTHAVHARARLVEALGVNIADGRLAYAPTPAELAAARAWLAQQFPGPARPMVGFQVASFPTKAYRDWPLESFIALGERILAHAPDAHLLVLGAKESCAKADTLVARFGARAASAAGRFSLRETAALMAALRLYVGVDTGPTHLAGALGIPMVAMYHCRHRGRYLAPLGHDRLHVIEHPADDSVCQPATPMASISVDAVWQSVAQLLGQTR
jgi:heptosyltransferase-3